MKNFTKSLLLLLLIGSFFDIMAQRIVYFDASNKNTTKDGKSWKTAYSSFSSFFDGKQTIIIDNKSNQQIYLYLAEGNYDIGEYYSAGLGRNAKNHIHLSSGVHIIGGFRPKSDGSYELINGIGKTKILGSSFGNGGVNAILFHKDTFGENNANTFENLVFDDIYISSYNLFTQKKLFVFFNNCSLKIHLNLIKVHEVSFSNCIMQSQPSLTSQSSSINLEPDKLFISNCGIGGHGINIKGDSTFLVNSTIQGDGFGSGLPTAYINSKFVAFNSLNVVNTSLLLSTFFQNQILNNAPNHLEINYSKFQNSSVASNAKKIFVAKSSFLDASMLIATTGTEDLSNFKVLDTEFIGSKSFLISNGNGLIMNCKFENCNEALKFNLHKDVKAELQIASSHFKKNMLSIGGSIPKNQNLLITDCNFLNNESGIEIQNSGSINVENCNLIKSGRVGLRIYNFGITNLNNLKIDSTNLGHGIFIQNKSIASLNNIKSTNSFGGGNQIHAEINSKTTIENSFFSGSKPRYINSGIVSGQEGSGMSIYTYSNSIVNLKRCIFSNNKYGISLNPEINYTSTFPFGKIFIDECNVFGNTVGVVGKGNCEIKMNECSINENINGEFGGGVYMNAKKFEILNSRITNNKSNFINLKGENIGGGGIVVNPLEDSENIISNCLISNNSTDEAGGGIKLTANNVKKYIFHIYNTVFHNNTSKQQGGAIFCTGNSPNSTGSNIVMTNCTVYDNLTFDLEQGGGGGFSSNLQGTSHIRNSIFWNNKLNKSTTFSGADIFNKNGQLKINNSLLQLDSTKYIGSNSFAKLGNIFAKNPRFLDSTSNAGKDNLFNTNDDGFRLTTESPCLNIGENNYNATVYSLDYDIAGNPRIQDKIIDLGAYEGGVKVVHTVPQPNVKTIIEGSTADITLLKLTDYGNTVTYIFVSGPATLKDNVLTPTGKPGKITVTGRAAGTEKDATISICVNPSKPTIILRDVEGDYFLKSSTTTGNIWFNNDKKTTLTNQEITALYDSFYTLQIDVEGCLSTFSDKIVVPKDKVHTIGIITLADLKEGNEKTIDIPAKTDFGNTVNYTITGPAAISNGKLTVGTKPGLVQIVGKANKTPKDVIYKFCVIPNKPTISLINNNGVYNVKSSLPDGNIWFKNDTKINFTTQEISADYEATYKLQIDLSGCVSEVSDKMIIPKLVILGVEDSFENEIVLYPNPTNNELIVKSLTRSSPVIIKIMDITGRVILSEKYNSSESNIKLNFTNFASGTYLIELETNKTKLIKKIIKQ